MDSMRRTGLVLAAVASALWILFAALFLGTDPDDGANIGAGLAAILAVLLSVASLTVLLFSLRSPGSDPAPKGRDARVGAPVAVVSLVLFVGAWVFSSSADTDATGTVLLAVVAAAVLTFVAAAVLFVPPRRGRS
ncbi:hypothetical protein [Blastococcus atacamensis]|uniref:hypothetical protein n=1 Tax=Blastococcus atacamensis TaxID=2070508 RepID=UPI000CECB58A|nr:hypothetical protein [Blastococcus atacamensis]